MNIFKSFFKSRDKPRNASVGTSWFHIGRSWSGKAVTERTALQQTAVYACVRIIAETIASLPLHLYKYTDNGKEKDCTPPLYYLLHDEPNHEMTAFVFRETIVSHLLLWGNAYAQIIRNGKGEIIELYPLLPDKMEVYRSDITGEIYYIYTDTKGQRHTLSNIEILHIPGLGYDGLIGHSPIAMTKNAIGLSIAAEEYSARFFANSANPSMMLCGEVSGFEKGIDFLNEIKESIINAYQNKTELSRAKISKMMDSETWMNAKSAYDLRFCDKIMYSDNDKLKSGTDFIFDKKSMVTNTVSAMRKKLKKIEKEP